MEKRVARGVVDSLGKTAPAPAEAANPMRGLLPRPAPRGQETAAKEAAALNQGERMKLAKEGKALPDGSFPIRNAEDLEKARIRAHQADNEGAAKSLIRKRAKDLGVKLPSGY